MTAPRRARTCRDCKDPFPATAATNADGQPAPRGFYCPDCGQRRARQVREAIARRDGNICRNLWAAYRGWWKHYTPPTGWAALLRAERETCPYCGGAFSKDLSLRSESFAVIDHMDPLSRGGEDSLRNAMYCCYLCNGRKKNKLFVHWLQELSEPYRSKSREIYVFKHEHPPEAFQEGEYELRRDGVPMFLGYDEKEFKRALRGMLPLQTTPPAAYLSGLVQPHPGPVDLQSLIFREATRVAHNGT